MGNVTERVLVSRLSIHITRPMGHPPGMATPPVTQRLAELLIEPRETLEVEAKRWIDIVNDGDHKALLAKAIIALANHGGGVVTIGFEKSANGLVPAQGRPPNLAGYTSDTVNAVVSR
jgi:hypothetical protein